MKNIQSITALVAVVSMILMAGCNKAKIPDEGKVMRDANGNEYLVKYHMGNVYTLDIIPFPKGTGQFHDIQGLSSGIRVAAKFKIMTPNQSVDTDQENIQFWIFRGRRRHEALV